MTKARIQKTHSGLWTLAMPDGRCLIAYTFVACVRQFDRWVELERRWLSVPHGPQMACRVLA